MSSQLCPAGCSKCDKRTSVSLNSCCQERDLLSGIRRFIVIGFELQLADSAFGNSDVIPHFAEIFRLYELSIGSGMAVEVTDFHDLLHVREWVTIGYAHGSHESRLVLVQKIHGDRPVTVLRLLVG